MAAPEAVLSKTHQTARPAAWCVAMMARFAGQHAIEMAAQALQECLGQRGDSLPQGGW